MTESASARPSKRLFISLITRDITLEDAILDLIDNSINSLIIDSGVALLKLFDEIVGGEFQFEQAKRKYEINIKISSECVEVIDNCGGIKIEHGKNSVFRLGRPAYSKSKDTLSVYGIGLKRALFKIGNQVSITSNFGDGGFLVGFNVKEWGEKKLSNGEDDWTLPFEEKPKPTPISYQTNINIHDLNTDIKERMKHPNFLDSLERRIRETYSFFTGNLCKISLNGKQIEHQPLTFGTAQGLRRSAEKFTEYGCGVHIFAGLAPREDWRYDQAGWYIFCNGRAVLFADKSKLTGWSNGGPGYVSKYRGFKGLVFFFSENPEKLPWTTTKTDINEEAMIFQRAFSRMLSAARPVFTFLNSIYDTDETEAAQARSASEAISSSTFTHIVGAPKSTFSAPKGTKPSTVTAQFPMKIDDLELVRQFLRRPSLSAREAAQIAFKHYLKHEVSS